MKKLSFVVVAAILFAVSMKKSIEPNMALDCGTLVPGIEKVNSKGMVFLFHGYDDDCFEVWTTKSTSVKQ